MHQCLSLEAQALLSLFCVLQHLIYKENHLNETIVEVYVSSEGNYPLNKKFICSFAFIFLQ